MIPVLKNPLIFKDTTPIADLPYNLLLELTDSDIMTSDRELRRDHERDRAKVVELNKQNEKIELVQLENFYLMKISAVKIHDDKYSSKDRWSKMIIVS